MSKKNADPLTGTAPKEIALSKAPLVRVICQVRFSEVLLINREDFIAGFQEAIRREFPVFRREEVRSVVFGHQGSATDITTKMHWRFFDAKEEWRVSLSTDFVALETIKYKTRSDFIKRLVSVLEAVKKHIEPSFATRVGIRYLDRVNGEPLERLQDLLRPEMLGLANTFKSGLIRAMSEANCEVKEGHLHARWGRMPSNASHDQDNLPPVNEQSWILDIDTFKRFEKNMEEFDVQKLRKVASSLATRSYTFFRWAVTPEFLRYYGGKV